MNFRSLFSYFTLIILHLTVPVAAQNIEYLKDMPGEYIVTNNLNKCPGLDYATYSRNLAEITDWFHKNHPVFSPPTGFNASVKMSGNLCDEDKYRETYGYQSYIYFSFHYFYNENGKTEEATDWLAHGTELCINNPLTNICRQFGGDGFKTGDPPELEQPLEAALARLSQYYYTHPVDRNISPGVTLFAGGTILVYDPSRPWIWTPVTVKEIMEALLAYYKIEQEADSISYENALREWAKMDFKPEKAVRPDFYNIIKKEYENFSPDDLNKEAFYNHSEENFSSINAKGDGMPVMKFNTSSWDRSLPRTAVQFITVEYKPRTEGELEEFIQNNGASDYVGLYMKNLPVAKLGALINRN